MAGHKHKHIDMDRLRSWTDFNLESLVEKMFPNGKILGNDYVVGSIYGEKGTSLRICINGSRRGQWLDWSNGDDRGDFLKLWQKRYNKTFYQAALELSEIAGGEIFSKKHKPAVRTKEEILAQKRIEDTINNRKKNDLNKIWKSSVLVDLNSLLHVYLKNRGIDSSEIQISKDIRVNPSIELRDENKEGNKIVGEFPCIVALSRNVHDNKATGMQRIYIDNDGGKIDTKSPTKRMKGAYQDSMKQSAVRLSEEALNCEIMCVSEGIETGFSVMSAYPKIPVRAALSTSNLKSFSPPDYVKTLIIAADYDRSAAGIKAAVELKESMEEKRPELMVYIVIPNDCDIPDKKKGIDFADLNKDEIISYFKEIKGIDLDEYQYSQPAPSEMSI